jgi:hypothetical protein
MSTSLWQIVAAIRTVQAHVWWKPGSLDRHLNTRKKRNHLPPKATAADYEAIVQGVLTEDANIVYLFHMNGVDYVTIVEPTERPWLVMFDLNGLMETAFIVENPQSYLNKREFSQVDTVQRVLSHERAN